jgi:hypothetical protein
MDRNVLAVIEREIDDEVMAHVLGPRRLIDEFSA